MCATRSWLASWSPGRLDPVEDYTPYGELDQHINTGITVELQGWIDCVSIEGCTIYVGAVTPSDCAAVAIRELGWGALKTRF